MPISEEEIELYYEGFSNDGLWPLYHDALRESTYSSEQWDAYVAVNERFAATLADIAPPDAIVWIHDYQLQLVPELLRAAAQRRHDRVLPPHPVPAVRTVLPAALAHRDRRGAARLRPDRLPAPDATPRTSPQPHTNWSASTNTMTCSTTRTAPPIWARFRSRSTSATSRRSPPGVPTRQRMSQIRARLGDPEVILLGVDRLDYTKGIGLRLKAFAALLESGELDAERHVMVQVATPTREAVEHYQDERHEVERLVGAINGRYSRIGLPVVHYLYQTLPFDELIALYRAGDVMLVTPFRDGMNLVAKEYAASHIDGDGVLVLSEFAGAADELTDAVQVNPHDDHALQQAIVTAVEMHRHERRDRMAGLRDQIRKSDVQGWADRFLVRSSRDDRRSRRLTEAPRR